MITLLLACIGGPPTDPVLDTATPAEEESEDPGPAELIFSFGLIADPHVTDAGDHAERLALAVADLNATATTFAELRDQVLACWFSADERRLAAVEEAQLKISLLEAGKQPTVVERFSQLPAPTLSKLSGRSKTKAKVQVDKV